MRKTDVTCLTPIIAAKNCSTKVIRDDLLEALSKEQEAVSVSVEARMDKHWMTGHYLKEHGTDKTINLVADSIDDLLTANAVLSASSRATWISHIDDLASMGVEIWWVGEYSERIDRDDFVIFLHTNRVAGGSDRALLVRPDLEVKLKSG